MKKYCARLLFCVPVFAIALHADIVAAEEFTLSLPYDLPAKISGAVENNNFSCPKPPGKPPHDLYFQSRYKRDDPARANVDEDAQAEYQKKTRDLRQFENMLLAVSNDYLRDRSPEKAGCVLDWLHDWAQGYALLGRVNATGIAVRQWMLSSISSAYAQTRDAEVQDAARKRRMVEAWLRACAKAVMDDYPKDAEKNSKRNNHLYWAAWAVAITGIAIDEKPLYDWGIDRARIAIETQLLDDGTLPLEMARGQKALHYHAFAAQPLIMLAEAGAANGDDLYGLRDGILKRMGKRIVKGMDDASYFEKKSGAAQIPAEKLHPGHFAWLEPFNRQFPSAEVSEKLASMRPLFLRRIGGDMTLLYAARPE